MKRGATFLRRSAIHAEKIGAMPWPFHALCEREEQMLRESAVAQLPDVALLDHAADELFRLTQEAKETGPAQGTRAGWADSSNGTLIAAAMALRTGRAVALLVRSGYGFEALVLVRRLGEITQHAVHCAQDPSGTYARNWGAGAGTAGKPSAAYLKGVADTKSVRKKWEFLSQMGHANARPYLNLMSARPAHDEIVSPVDPARHDFVDGLALSSAAWDLARTAGAVCIAHCLDDGPTLKLAEEMGGHLAASESRADVWLATHRQQMGEPWTQDEPT